MARKLKTYQTSLGFFDQAIAAPSMKAALEAWGADSNLFHQGAARESDDPDVVAATMAKPNCTNVVRTANVERFNRLQEVQKMLILPAFGGLERAKGIEPSYAAWEAAVLPLNYARDRPHH